MEYTKTDIDMTLKETEKLSQVVEHFCEVYGLDSSKIKANISTLKEIVDRVNKRKEYFKIFHENMDISEFKITSLTVFWILKLRPFWIDLDINEKTPEAIDIATKINEKIALHMVVTLLREFNPQFFEKGADLVKSYSDELLYSFRYRDLSKEAIFLMFEPFYYLYFFNTTVGEDGSMLL